MVQIIYEEFGDERIAFVPVGRGTVDLETHALLESVAVSVGKGWISPQAGTRNIEALVAHRPRFPLWLRLVAGGLKLRRSWRRTPSSNARASPSPCRPGCQSWGGKHAPSRDADHTRREQRTKVPAVVAEVS